MSLNFKGPHGHWSRRGCGFVAAPIGGLLPSNLCGCACFSRPDVGYLRLRSRLGWWADVICVCLCQSMSTSMYAYMHTYTYMYMCIVVHLHFDVYVVVHAHVKGFVKIYAGLVRLYLHMHMHRHRHRHLPIISFHMGSQTVPDQQCLIC